MTETIKLLELFSGIQSQERALRQLGIAYESVGVCDCDKDVLVASAAMRFDLKKEIENYDFPDAETMMKELQDKNIGYSFEKQKHTITSRTPISKLKQYYISDKLLKNLGDISKVKRLPRANFVTYSSPCQSFSVAGKLAGAAKTCTKCGHKWDIDFSNPDYNYKCPVCGNASLESTTSGLLQEVQRLLAIAYEENELPEYLMLENVKNLVQKKFIGQFNAWVRWLDSIGYNTYWKVLNAKNFGIPQNRERVFAISIRKDIDTNGFTFPEPISLTTRLKDILEHDVPEKYYLPDDRIEKILNSSFMQEKKRIQTTDVCDTLLARDWKDPKCVPIEEDVNPIRIGNIYDEKFGTGYAGNVWDKDGISPTLQTAQGGNRMPLVIEEKEPFIVASRGRNPENPSDRTTGAPTEQRLEPNFSGCTNTLTSVQKDNYVCEPQVIIGSMQKNAYVGDASISPSLTAAMGMGGGQTPMVGYIEPQVLRAERTEYGKAVRKQYEAGEVDEKIGNMREMKPRTDGVSNTITTLLKDNYVVEPIVEKVAIVEDQFPGSRDARIYKEYSPTLRQNCGALQVAKGEEETEINPKLVGGIGEKNFGKQYRQGNRVYDSNEIAMELNAQPVGNTDGYSYLYAVEEEQPKIRWRIRKLTPKECWRLMGFTDQDHDRAAKYTSVSARYKQAGNSICTCCLISIFSSLFLEDGYKSDVWTKYLLKYDD